MVGVPVAVLEPLGVALGVRVGGAVAEAEGGSPQDTVRSTLLTLSPTITESPPSTHAGATATPRSVLLRAKTAPPLRYPESDTEKARVAVAPVASATVRTAWRSVT
jgi:hypothetical protein